MRPEDTQTPPTEPQPATSTTRSTTATADRDGFTAHDGFTAFRDDERDDARRRWEEIESRFVDDPAGATKEADDLLGDTMDRITQRWHEHRSALRERWDDDDASTEELRTALKRYRDALDGLLSR